MVKFPKFNRKQKIVRNLILTICAIVLMSWMLAFPSLTKAGLLRRVEQNYLLEHSELLFTAKNERGLHTLYARNGKLLLAVNYSPTPLGLHDDWSNLIDETDGIYCDVSGYHCVSAIAIGAVEEADRAELTVTMEVTMDGVELEKTYVTQGVRENPYCFRFDLKPQYAQDDEHLAARAEREIFADIRVPNCHNSVLRLYDGQGNLLHEKEIEWFDVKMLAW